ncbi:hypothetical protein ACRYCC_26310 [Actinomadura scrupuli]|uniref:hypothetical protein n=1 Tax=Actinomadura scrupuli TaxID=559629 RepID=UPI003D966829
MPEFQIAEGYVDVHLKDHTDTELQALMARLRASGGATLPVSINDQTGRGLRELDARMRTWSRTHGQNVDFRANTGQLEASMLAARRTALAAAEATDKLTAAQRVSREVAERLAREELSEAEAARLTTQAARGLERAEIAQAAAARAAAAAADHLAAQQRQLARDTELARVADMLSMQRAAGNRRIYNNLLNDTRRRFGSLEGTAAGSFREIENLGQRAFGLFQRSGTSATNAVGQGLTKLGEMGPMSVAGIAVAIAALPALAVGVGGAITLGLGGGLAAAAIMAASKNKEVEASFTHLKDHVGKEMRTISEPFVPELERMAQAGERVFDSWAPHLDSVFEKIAPAVGHFVDETADGLERFGPMFDKIGDEFDPLIRELGDEMPVILNNIASGIEAAVGAADGHEADFASFATNLSKIVLYGGQAVGALSKAYDWVSKFASFPDSPWAFIKDAIPPLNVAVGLFNTVADLWDRASGGGEISGEWKDLADAAGQFAAKAPSAASAASQIAADLKKAGDASQGVEAQVNALTAALNRLFNPQLAVYQDTTRMKQGFLDLVKALKASHGNLGLATEKSRAARDAFASQLQVTSQLAQSTLNSTHSMGKARAAVAPMIEALYRLAAGNKNATKQVDNLAQAVGLVPKSVTTKVKGEISDLQHKIEAAKAKLKTVPPSKQSAIKATIADLERKVAAAKARLAGIQGKTVTINMNQVWSSSGAYIGGRGGGPGRADGGIDFHRYAAGGVRHDLPPHITDTPTVLYGEPETGGEAFIPLGASKRQRSTGLLAEVAAMFGLVLSKRMADGGILGDWTDEVEAYANGGFHKSSINVHAKAVAAAKAKAKKSAAGASLIAGITSSMLSSLDSINSYATKVNNQIKATFSGKTETKLLAWAKGIESKMATASKSAAALADKIKEAKDYSATTKTSMLGTATLANVGTVANASDIKSGLNYRLNSLRAFSSKLSALVKAGLNKTMLQQVIDLGPEQGTAIADMLLKDTTAIKDVNATQSQLDSIAGTIGNNAADAMYDSGKNASKGFLSGLYGQQVELNALMQKLGAQMAAGLKKSFGVKSSSWGKASVPKKHAAGGIAQAGELALMGEEGPELVRVGSTSRVFTAQETAALAGGGGVTIQGGIHVHVTGTLDFTDRRQRERIAKSMVVEIKEELRLWDRAHRR